MLYNTIKTASIFNDPYQGNTLAKRIDDSAARIISLFPKEKFPDLVLTPEFVREQIAKVQLQPSPLHKGLMSAVAGDNVPFTPMAADADLFGMLAEVISKLDQLKGFAELGVYHDSKVTNDFESANFDNLLNTFKGIATEVVNLGAAAATGGAVPTLDVSSIVNTITESIQTAMNHSSGTLNKHENGQLIATRKGPNGPEYIGIKYQYNYKLEQWRTCGKDHNKAHYDVEKAFFVSYSLAQFRSLYAKAFPDQKDYFIVFYFGDKVLEGTGPVLTREQVEENIISALGNTVASAITEVQATSAGVFMQVKATISIKESGIQALLNSKFKSMTLKKTDSTGRTDYYSIKIQLMAAA